MGLAPYWCGRFKLLVIGKDAAFMIIENYMSCIKERYKKYDPSVYIWRDTAPAPFDGDYLLVMLDDDDIVAFIPKLSNQKQSFLVHAKYNSWAEVVFEILHEDTVPLDDLDNFVRYDEIICLIDREVSTWKD